MSGAPRLTLTALTTALALMAAPIHAEQLFPSANGSIFIGSALVLQSSNDKVQHFGSGMVLSGVAQKMGANFWQRCAITAAAGILKEAYDSKNGGSVEALDALATTVGCLRFRIEF